MSRWLDTLLLSVNLTAEDTRPASPMGSKEKFEARPSGSCPSPRGYRGTHMATQHQHGFNTRTLTPPRKGHVKPPRHSHNQKKRNVIGSTRDT